MGAEPNIATLIAEVKAARESIVTRDQKSIARLGTFTERGTGLHAPPWC
jgi:antitoxin (DNA-binding transcriptional repressor) of toxin-antitoxin stability system